MKKIILLSFILFGFFTTSLAQDSTSYKIRASTKTLASSYLRIPTNAGSNLHLDTSFTLECWIYVDSKDSGKQFNIIQSFGNITGFKLYLDSDSYYKIYLWDTATNRIIRSAHWSSLNLVKYNQWTHLAVSFNARNGVFHRYINGAFVLSKAIGSNPVRLNISNSDYKIGANGTDGAAEADFKVDDIRIWKYVRSESEINANYKKCLTGNEDNLLAYYTFEDATDLSSIEDKSGNGNTGQLTSSPERSRLVSGANGCETTITSVFGVETKEVKIYPNPTSSILNLETDSPFTIIKVLNVQGKVVKSFHQASAQLSVVDLPEGIYTLQIIGDNEVSYAKFIKN